MKVGSKISLLHFLEVNRKTRNNMGNKSWRILDMAWVQRHMSVEGKKQSKSEVWCKAKRNTYLKRCEELKTHRLGWAVAEDPNWKEKAVEVEEG